MKKLIISIFLLTCITQKSFANKESKYTNFFSDHKNHQNKNYICPMHPNIKKNTEGNCPICGMDLVLFHDEDINSNQENIENQSHNHEAKNKKSHLHHHTSVDTDRHDSQSFTCPMHPNIKQNTEGSCPICGMNLVQLETEKTSDQESYTQIQSIKIKQASRRLAGIETEKVKKKQAFQTLNVISYIDFDEERISNITAYASGRIEKLFANYTGVHINKNDHLVKIYSPELYSAQVEYLEVLKTLKKMKSSFLKTSLESQNLLLKTSEAKLYELGISAEQIKNLKKSLHAKSDLIINSNISGTVIEKKVFEGSYVKAGDIIYRIADLSRVWLVLDMFPEETNLLKFGLKVKARVRSQPHKEFNGRISFISPVINKKTRTVRVRVHISNEEGLLKPGDFAEAHISIPITSQRYSSKTYDVEYADKYISPMHPNEISDKPGKCPVCGMDLVHSSNYGFTEDESFLEKLITVPKDAILSIGKNHAVFVNTEKNFFTLRKIKKGPNTEDNRVVVFEGLEEDEVIATKGVFLIDSQMQLSGKTSLISISQEIE